MRTIALVAVIVAAFVFPTGPSHANEEYSIRQTLKDAEFGERVNSLSVAAFCKNPRSNTPEKCRADYEELLVDFAMHMAKQLEYLVAVKRGVQDEKLEALKKAWEEARAVSVKNGRRLDDLYWVSTSTSANTTGKSPQNGSPKVLRTKGKQ